MHLSVAASSVRARYRTLGWIGRFLLCASFVASASAEGSSTDAAGEPRAERAGVQPPKVIYGADDRADFYEESDEARKGWAASVCALVEETNLAPQSDGSFAISTVPYTISGLLPCEGEAFPDQPRAAFCTGFMVGPDLIATAGHCVQGLEDLAAMRFVFGFVMTDADSPVSTFAADRVYTGVELVAREEDFAGADYAIVRIDRPIAAPGAVALPIRRTGTLAPGTKIGVIGHPAGLPLKFAFGDATVVSDSSPEAYFLANLDAFGGNSGSPVFDAETGIVEGILVRGATDFEVQDGNASKQTSPCFRSIVLPVGEAHEEATKSIEFSEILYNPAGQLAIDKPAYRCEDTVVLHLHDISLEFETSASVLALTDGGDEETIALGPTGRPGEFSASVAVGPGEPAPGNGQLEAAEGSVLLFVYVDDDNGTGSTVSTVASAIVDCTAPEISDVSVDTRLSRRAVVHFATDEGAFSTVQGGTTCADDTIVELGDLAADHTIAIDGLAQEMRYQFRIAVRDAAGNERIDDNGGACHEFTTSAFMDRFTEKFEFPLLPDLAGKSMVFEPVDGGAGYSACLVDGAELQKGGCGRRLAIGDDVFREYVFANGHRFPFYGIEYDRMYVGSNGYITFGAGDTNFSPDLESHFSLPRISVFFTDLYVGLTFAREFRVSEQSDRLVVTYEGSPLFANAFQFQAELFYSGVIRLKWLSFPDSDGIAGLSDGEGRPEDYEASDLSEYGDCDIVPSAGRCEFDCGFAASPGDDGYGQGDAYIALAAVAIIIWRGNRSRRPIRP